MRNGQKTPYYEVLCLDHFTLMFYHYFPKGQFLTGEDVDVFLSVLKDQDLSFSLSSCAKVNRTNLNVSVSKPGEILGKILQLACRLLKIEDILKGHTNGYFKGRKRMILRTFSRRYYKLLKVLCHCLPRIPSFIGPIASLLEVVDVFHIEDLECGTRECDMQLYVISCVCV